ncbi:MAG TPA: DUF1080 domain-containing protein [Pirellulales bacterium]
MIYHRLWTSLALVAGLAVVLAARAEEPAAKPGPALDKLKPGQTADLFDGKTLAGWKTSDFAGHGPVKVEDRQIMIETGSELTGITWTGSLPRVDYELTLEAMRVDGHDFFCGLTFPVGDSPCSLIVGGWGGSTVGLSSIDGLDASENETGTYHSFNENKWYTIRVRVTGKEIKAWIDKEQVVDIDYSGRKVSIRFEVEPSTPLGVATWCTSAAVRNIRLKKL